MPAPFLVGTIGIGTAVVAGVLAEPVDTAYARQPIVVQTVTAGVGGNRDIATFGPAVARWGTINRFAVYDGAGNLVFTGTLDTPFTVATGGTAVFLPGQVALTFPPIT